LTAPRLCVFNSNALSGSRAANASNSSIAAERNFSNVSVPITDRARAFEANPPSVENRSQTHARLESIRDRV